MTRGAIGLTMLLVGAISCAAKSRPSPPIPFELHKNQVAVETWIGKDGPYTMIVDTGADPSAIDLETARRAGIEIDTTKSGVASGVGSERPAVYPVTLRDVRIGEAEVGDVEALAIDLGKLSERFGRPLHGILGYSVLKGRRVRFDYPAGTVMLDAPSEPCGAARSEIPFRFVDDDIMPIIDIVVNGTTLPVSVDTGSSLTLELFPDAVARLGLEEAAATGTKTSVAGARGTMEASEGTVSAVQVGTFGLGAQRVSFTSREQTSPNRLGNVGNGLLRTFCVTVDYGRRTVTLEGKAAPAEPRLFGEGVVSTEGFETHPAFTPDGRTLYFVRSTPAFTDWKIWVTRFDGTRWSPPEMAPFSGTHRDADPYVTPDGKRLYFISDRPVDGKPKEDMDVWVMERTTDGAWGEPRNVGAPINSAGSEWLPRPSANGTMYFGSDRPGGLGKTDLYRARRAGDGYGEPENLGPAINSAAEEFEPCIAPDESFLVFMAAGRPDDLGGGDLYVSYAKDGAWTPARNLGPKINGRGLDIGPYLSLDGRRFYWGGMRRRGFLADVFEIDLDALHEPGR